VCLQTAFWAVYIDSLDIFAMDLGIVQSTLDIRQDVQVRQRYQ